MTKGRDTPLGKGPEFDAIRALVAQWGPIASGIGDDAAMLEVPRGEQLITSVDAFVEGIHFRAEWIDAREVGYRAATAALSDLAAMGAQPLGLLFAIILPERWRPSLEAIGAGVGAAAAAAFTVIIGGNISSGAELSITTTVLGHAFAPLTRSGAKAGDRLYVTGALGGPGAAIAAWRSGREPDAHHRARFSHPIARIEVGRVLADRGAHACIDISDGLASDLDHLATASGVSFAVQIERLPLVAGVTWQTAIISGEEYELLIAAPPLDVNELSALLKCPITEIGQVVNAHGGFTEHGQPVLVSRGHDHLT